jgi:tetratricopeptide (TPR) repeat protein
MTVTPNRKAATKTNHNAKIPHRRDAETQRKSNLFSASLHLCGGLCLLLQATPGFALGIEAQQMARFSWQDSVRALLAEKDFLGAAAVLKKERPRLKDNHEIDNLLGATLERAGRISEATAWYLKALELRPRSTTARLNLALNCIRLGQFGRASNEFIRVLKDAPLEPVREPVYQQGPDEIIVGNFVEKVPARERDWYELGLLFLRHGRLQAARKIFERATGNHTDSARLYYGLGWALQEGGQFEAAREALTHALALQPSFPEAALRLGYSYHVHGDRPAAVRIYEGILRTHPESYEARFFLAQSLAEGAGGELERAIEQLRRALAINPRSFDSQILLGKIFLKMGRLSDAVREFEQAVRLNPNHETAHYLLAQSYTRLGENALATRQFQALQILKEQERNRARQMMHADLFGGSESGSAPLAERVQRFIDKYRAALLAGNYLQIWRWLTAASRAFYDNDATEYVRVATLVFGNPAVRERLRQSRLTGGRQVAGRILCEFDNSGGEKMPALVVVEEGGQWKIDYALDWTTAGLGYLGAR